MQLSTLAIIASSLVAANAQDFVTYTKNLGSTTIVVTNYVGTTPLTGSLYTTDTVVVTAADGTPEYTKFNTRELNSSELAALATATSTEAAAAETTAAAATSDADWVTYTKDLGTATIVVTRYLGTTALTGADYTTKTVVVSGTDGVPKYTETVVGLADTASTTAAAETTAAAASSDADWVTYTKDLGTATIVVTRYLGTTALTGSEYTTKTVVVSGTDGVPKYTETVVGLADTAAATSAAASSEAAVSSEIASSSAIVSEVTGYSNSTSTYTEADESTTVITVTSCSDNACSEVPVTTGVTVVTETSEGVVTEYTTYCPLTGETSSVAPTAVTSTKEAASTGASISTFEGNAAAVGLSVGALALAAAALF